MSGGGGGWGALAPAVAAVAETSATRAVLERALSGERISDEDACTLLRSRDLVAVGRAANELRNRATEPGVVTFIVDRNMNYTNVCYTECAFCAFYRRPATPARATRCRGR